MRRYHWFIVNDDRFDVADTGSNQLSLDVHVLSTGCISIYVFMSHEFALKRTRDSVYCYPMLAGIIRYDMEKLPRFASILFYIAYNIVMSDTIYKNRYRHICCADCAYSASRLSLAVCVCV